MHICEHVSMCIIYFLWKLDDISFNSCITITQAGNRNNHYCFLCVWHGREQRSCASRNSTGDDFSTSDNRHSSLNQAWKESRGRLAQRLCQSRNRISWNWRLNI